MHHPPDPTQRGIHRLPLPVFLRKLRSALIRNSVVFPTPAAVRDFPARFDVAESLKSVKNRIQHSIRPFHLTAGQLPNPLKDRISIAVRFG